MVAVLTGKDEGTVTVEGGAVKVNLAAMIDAVKSRLSERGFALVDKIPAVNVEFTIVESADLAKAQTGFRLLSAVATVLPWLALGLFAIAVAVARNRRTTLLVGSLAVALSMVLLGAALNFFRIIYLDAVPPEQLSPEAAGAIFDQLAYFIRLALRSVLVLFLVIAAIAWVTGPQPAPTSVRHGATQALDSVRNRRESAGLNTGAFGEAVYTSRTAIRFVVLGIALLVYVMAAHPTGAFTLTVLGIALVVLLLVELVAKPPAAVTDQAE
jgi:hypothetical protein